VRGSIIIPAHARMAGRSKEGKRKRLNSLPKLIHATSNGRAAQRDQLWGKVRNDKGGNKQTVFIAAISFNTYRKRESGMLSSKGLKKKFAQIEPSKRCPVENSLEKKFKTSRCFGEGNTGRAGISQRADEGTPYCEQKS